MSNKVTVGDNEELINNNGTLYIIGWNQGYFDITHVEEDPEEDGVYWTVGDYPTTSFSSENIETVISMMES